MVGRQIKQSVLWNSCTIFIWLYDGVARPRSAIGRAPAS